MQQGPRRYGFYLLILVGLLGVLGPARAALGGLAGTVGHGPGQKYVPVALSGNVIHAAPFTAHDRRRAIALFTTDPEVRAAVAGRRYTVHNVFPWYSSETGATLGAVIEVTFVHSATLNKRWAFMTYQPGGRTMSPYAKFKYRLKVDDVSGLRAYVDFAKTGVASLQPTGAHLKSSQAPQQFQRLARSMAAAKTLAVEPGSPQPTVIPGDGGGVFGVYYANNTWFWNWDFGSQVADSAHLDFPITFIFANGATINKVKDGIGWGCNFCSTQYMQLADTDSVSRWDSDDGKKDGCYTVGADTHFREYADPRDDRMGYTTLWGYYTIASTHHDVNECGPSGRSYGWSEDAAGDLGNTILNRRNVTGWDLFRDHIYIGNGFTQYSVADHTYQSDGNADYVLVP